MEGQGEPGGVILILRNDLKDISSLKKLSLRVCEKDYLLETMMFFLSDMKRTMVFKGGTALYKFYGLNRFSEDLDFDLTGKRNESDRIIERIKRNLDLMGMAGTIAESEDHGNETNIRFLIRGPLYDEKKTSMTRIVLNLSKRERPESGSLKMLIPQYPDLVAFEMNVLSQEEISSEKIRCILTRNKPRDIYDLWFLFKKGIKPEHSLIKRKLSIYDLEYSKETMLSRIDSMERMWTRDLKGIIIGSLPAFSEISMDLEGLLPE